MNRREFTSNLIAGILLTVCFGVALYFRVVLPYHNVFVGDWIKFTGVDAYYFMRLADNLVHNFPHFISFDPYSLYPSGSLISTQFWPYFISGVAWVAGLGSPSQHTVDVVGVYFPAVLGALTTIPVYFIGKTLFNRWAGVIAAGLVAILPGEFLGRSILGFTDYHVAEVSFTTVTMLFLILAVKASRDKQLSFSSLRHRQWVTLTKPFIYSLLAGVFLGIYFLTWAGALLFVFIIFIYLVIQFIIDHLKKRPTEYLCFVSTITFIVTLLLFLLQSPGKMALASLFIAIIVPIALAVLSYFMARRDIKPIIYPVSIVGLGLVSITVLWFSSPSLIQPMIRYLSIFGWGATPQTVLEMQPLLFPGGSFSWAIAWGNFTTSLFFSLISLGILIYLVIKRGETEKTLFLIWSLIILAATLAMRRFAYYLIINVALLTGYLSWLILEFSGLKKLTAAPGDIAKESKGKFRQQKRGGSRFAARAGTAVGIVAIFFIVFFPNFNRAVYQASQAVFAPSDAWYESLTWLQDNTPEPFSNPDYYYELYKKPPLGESYNSPDTAYGVTAWWDYGYWITRIGRRIPTSNPGTGNMGEAYIFTAQDEKTANSILDNWNTRYIIIDHAVTNVIQGKFNAIATLSGNSPDKFFDVYYQFNDNTFEPVLLFYPEYYRSLGVHLYYLDGGNIIPSSTIVISYQDKISNDGQPYKQLIARKDFSSYEDAQAYIASQNTGSYRIVSPNPRVSPVPLPALEHYKLIYTSKNSVIAPIVGMVPEVKIFEYIK